MSWWSLAGSTLFVVVGAWMVGTSPSGTGWGIGLTLASAVFAVNVVVAGIRSINPFKDQRCV